MRERYAVCWPMVYQTREQLHNFGLVVSNESTDTYVNTAIEVYCPQHGG